MVEDMNFLFECSSGKAERSKRLRYCFCHTQKKLKNINSYL